MKKHLLLFILALLPLVASAYDAEIDGIYYNFSDNEASVTYREYYYYSGFVSIPSMVTYNGKPYSVTSIGDGAFSGCSRLVSITIPESVTSIGNSAFAACPSLTSITIPESVTNIGYAAFSGCSGLTSITIPESVTSIGEYAFSGSGLISITIPESVTSIGDYAFRDCSGLTSITIPESVTSIGSYAFYYCTGLTSITIPNSVTSIGSRAFSGCSSLASITIPESVTSIGILTFSGCYFLTDCFINNSSLINYGNWGATLCDEETDDGLLILKASIQKCRSWATSITIPNNITSINGSAFSECKLHDIFVRCNVPPQLGDNSFTEQTYTHGILYVPTDCWDAYAYDKIWYKFINIRETATAKNQVSTQKAYTLMDVNRFTYSVYDPVNDCIDTNRPANGINEDNPNHCWQIIEWGDEHYLYNIGAKKFAKRGGNGIALTDSPAPIEMADGESGIVLGGQTAEQWALVHNENMNVNQSPITGIAPTIQEGSPDIHYYDLCGRQTKDARKGINIIGRKKILIK